MPGQGPTPLDLPPAKLFEEFFELAQQLQKGMEQEAGAITPFWSSRPFPLPSLSLCSDPHLCR